MKAPLEGVRVVEIAHFVAVPAAGSLLADLGADVSKIEAPPQGEIYRRGRPLLAGLKSEFPEAPGLQVDSRGKRSLMLDLTDPAAMPNTSCTMTAAGQPRDGATPSGVATTACRVPPWGGEPYAVAACSSTGTSRRTHGAATPSRLAWPVGPGGPSAIPCSERASASRFALPVPGATG